MKHFDRIDIIFIVLISIYLLVLFIGILWFILDRIEKKYCLPKKNVTLVEEKKNIVKKQNNNKQYSTSKKQTSIKSHSTTKTL